MKTRILLTRLLLLFWSLYFVFVAGSNLVDAFQQLGWVPETWSFTSGNFGLVVTTVSTYGLSKGFAAILFTAVILLELSAAWFFAAAARDTWRRRNADSANVSRGFVSAIGLFAGFIVADEFFVVYHRVSGLEITHLLVLCALLLTVLVVERQSRSENR
ncbi:MAG: hypothetical protein WBW88_16335 [Rhodothermales bacterium]